MNAGEELAWAAGLFEGEGWITNRPWKDEPRKRTRQLGLGSTDEDVVRRFHRIVGFGSVSTREGTNRPMWIWRGCGWGAMCDLLLALRPHLGERRTAQADEFLSHPPLRRRRTAREMAAA